MTALEAPGSDLDMEGNSEDDVNAQSEDGLEEEWGGIRDPGPGDTETAAESQRGTKPKKPPTGEELRAIKDATDLFKSSSFKLQVC